MAMGDTLLPVETQTEQGQHDEHFNGQFSEVPQTLVAWGGEQSYHDLMPLDPNDPDRVVFFDHGYVSGKEHLEKPARYFVRNGERVVAQDAPRSGTGVYEDGIPRVLRQRADNNAALIEELDPKEVWMVGHSMGNTTATLTAYYHPDLPITKIVGINGHGFEDYSPRNFLSDPVEFAKNVAVAGYDIARIAQLERRVEKLMTVARYIGNAPLRTAAELVALARTTIEEQSEEVGQRIAVGTVNNMRDALISSKRVHLKHRDGDLPWLDVSETIEHPLAGHSAWLYQTRTIAHVFDVLQSMQKVTDRDRRDEASEDASEASLEQ